MKTKERMIHQYVREKFEAEGKKVEVPHYTTLAKVWKEWFGAEGASDTSAPLRRWRRAGRR
ncbi:hypothetical protein HRW23_24980 [Streptomyces lunaelactis]|uniref:hypothetical protein n=1 Tax=Streptomyces lunaelactis TaxID=1535768 RepID=UPI001584D6F0|nr:hypothetical protein [Streptomyces lunaelactis]NUK08346.1 hypothetical protein [Streptomyces lunaelactis]NUK33299.1 hypothetical protein [Streptomyces lunaelactis]NUK39819.1 hypothetical protein [Streptomyces lunaelactis]NUK49673.1 hypothetical protein [Streptomyces lunaelactis]NUK56111.1 hypothetical protein [Streptomyces lunaelactis]